MPDLVVWPESTLHIALWVKSKIAAIWQGQTEFVPNTNLFHSRQNRSIIIILVSTREFSYTHDLSKKHFTLESRNKYSGLIKKDDRIVNVYNFCWKYDILLIYFPNYWCLS